MDGLRGPFASPASGDPVAERTAGAMKRSQISPPRDPGRADDVRDLVSLGDFLAPEMHRTGGIDEPAAALPEWVDDDVAMILGSRDRRLEPASGLFGGDPAPGEADGHGDSVSGWARSEACNGRVWSYARIPREAAVDRSELWPLRER
jgi:hypothetical protein